MLQQESSRSHGEPQLRTPKNCIEQAPPPYPSRGERKPGVSHTDSSHWLTECCSWAAWILVCFWSAGPRAGRGAERLAWPAEGLDKAMQMQAEAGLQATPSQQQGGEGAGVPGRPKRRHPSEAKGAHAEPEAMEAPCRGEGEHLQEPEGKQEERLQRPARPLIAVQQRERAGERKMMPGSPLTNRGRCAVEELAAAAALPPGREPAPAT